MYEVMNDASGGIHFFPLDDDSLDYRNGPPRPRPRRRPPRPRPRPRPPVIVQHAPPMPYPYPYPPPQYAQMPYPMPPHHPAAAPYGQQPAAGAVDMRVGLKAIGEFLPGLGQLLGAFRRAPERPKLSGQADRDMASLTDYIGETFERDRTGAQTAGVLATAGAVMKILAEL